MQQSFFSELKRRNVFRVAIAYGITAWFLLQMSDMVLPHYLAGKDQLALRTQESIGRPVCSSAARAKASTDSAVAVVQSAAGSCLDQAPA